MKNLYTYRLLQAAEDTNKKGLLNCFVCFCMQLNIIVIKKYFAFSFLPCKSNLIIKRLIQFIAQSSYIFMRVL
jgi:hypothetical protein